MSRCDRGASGPGDGRGLPEVRQIAGISGSMNHAVAVRAAGAMEFLGLPSGGAIALNFPMKSVFSGFDDRYGLCNTKLFGKVGLSFNVCIDTAR
jgi:hypothetical protein